MKNLATTNILLLVIAIALIAIAVRPYVLPRAAQAQTAPAQTAASDPLYIEPGTTMLRSLDGNTQVFGKMVVDMQTGSVWGFPTITGAPYPVDITTTKPPVSHPMFLGTFAFGDIDK
jgi:hypothetical protein